MRAKIGHVEIDHRRIVHDGGIVLTTEHIAGAPHVRGELIDLIHALIENCFPALTKAKIGNYEIVRRRRTEFGSLQIRTANPVTFTAQTLNHVTANKADRKSTR